ncbi:MAG: hypothetical protein JXR96_29150 [Deltaproteobacteria bacterium]|nr:hypothetical protein [Deltaproteobacteria bacterium]
MAVSLGGGYKVGDDDSGPLLAARGLFFFRYFLGVLHGDVAFGEGTYFSLAVDLDGRYGPMYGGLGFSLNWLPGAGSRPGSALGFQAGFMVPTPLTGLWLDICYRPAIIFRESQDLVYHNVLLAVILEAGL